MDTPPLVARPQPEVREEGGAVKIVGIVLLALGILALVYRGFSYTKETHEAKLGPISISVKDRKRVDVPVWAGVAAIVAGAALLLVPGRGGRR